MKVSVLGVSLWIKSEFFHTLPVIDLKTKQNKSVQL